MAEGAPTRQRLLEHGMRLFAERGFGATSVADIEVAAGLAPRRGGLYKHFDSKLALLEAAIRQYLDDAASVAGTLDVFDPGAVDVDAATLRTLVLAVGRVFLEAMDGLEDLTRLLEHDGPRLPHLTAAVKVDVVDLSYRTASRLIAAAAPTVADPDTTAIVVLASLVALRRTTWTFGTPPLSVPDDRFLEVWADATTAALRPR